MMIVKQIFWGKFAFAYADHDCDDREFIKLMKLQNVQFYTETMWMLVS